MVRAKVTYTQEQNGLIRPWRKKGLVFMNPPHSMSPNNIEPWMKKVHEEFFEHPIERYAEPDSLVILVPAKTDTEWFHQFVTPFAARCFLRGRPKFWQHGEEMKGPGKFASLIAYHGTSTGHFYSLFERHGWLS